MSLNKVFLHGNLTKDPEKRATAKGAVCCWLNIAINSTSNNESKAKYFYVQVWGSLAENCSKYLKKGSSVLVEGRLDYYIEEKNGYKNTKYYVSSDNVQFLSGGKSQQPEPEQAEIPF